MTTQQMTPEALTASAAPSRSTLAARSLAAVDKIADANERFAAFSRHMAEYPPLIASY